MGETVSAIRISGIRAFGYHGVLPEERAAGQEFVVDVKLTVDTTRAESSDDVLDTVHYGEVAQLIVEVVAGEPVNLIEVLAGRIADAVLKFDLVDQVEVTVHKPQAPIPVPFDDVSVTVARSR
jgi:7,8-dihydroneopterin aldolase/epimerase/oxygenase